MGDQTLENYTKAAVRKPQKKSPVHSSLAFNSLCPASVLLNEKTDLIGCINKLPQSRQAAINDERELAKTLLEQVATRRKDDNLGTAYFKRAVVKGMDTIGDGIALASNIHEQQKNEIQIQVTQVEEILKETIGFASHLALRLHLNPTLHQATVQMLPYMDFVPHQIGEISKLNDDNRREGNIVGRAISELDNTNKTLWDIFGLSLSAAIKLDEISEQPNWPSSITAGRSNRADGQSLIRPTDRNGNPDLKLTNPLERQLFCDRTEALQLVFITALNWSIVERHSLETLRKAFPNASLDLEIESPSIVLNPLKLYRRNNEPPQHKLTDDEVQRRIGPIINFENSRLLPMPWLASQFLKGQFAAAQQADGASRSARWNALINIIHLPKEAAKTDYNSQLDTIKKISNLLLNYGPSPTAESHAHIEKARKLATAMPYSGYERTAAITITNFAEVKTDLKLSIKHRTPLSRWSHEFSSETQTRQESLAKDPLIPQSLLTLFSQLERLSK